MLQLNRLPLPIREEAMNNHVAIPPSVRWEADGFPNQEDLQVWQFCQTVINRTQQPSCTTQVCTVLEQVILTDDHWRQHAPPDLGQSAGLVDTPFPELDPIGEAEMVRHLIDCRVCLYDLQNVIRPWLPLRPPRPHPHHKLRALRPATLQVPKHP